MEMTLSDLPTLYASLRKCRDLGPASFQPSPAQIASFQVLDSSRGESLTAEPPAPEAVGVRGARTVCAECVQRGVCAVFRVPVDAGPSPPGGQRGGVTPVPWLLPPPAIRLVPSSLRPVAPPSLWWRGSVFSPAAPSSPWPGGPWSLGSHRVVSV